jgi:hypothetical protein
MERGDQLSSFINHVVSDERLKPVHIALFTAVCHAWMASEFAQACQVSRSRLMQGSRILSKATYHKTLKDLQAFGYVEYRPSYHPTRGSAVTIRIRQNHEAHGEEVIGLR